MFFLSLTLSLLIAYKCDIFLDWDSQQASVYLNKTHKTDVDFYFSDVPNIDAVRVYNLKPSSTSFFKDIKVCSPSCDGIPFND